MSTDLIALCRVYLPAECQAALAQGIELPEQAHGAALFADISGFTALTEALTRALGLRRGAEELPIYLDRVYAGLIALIDRYGGSVIGFAGDAFTCWFDDQPAGQGGCAPGSLRAAYCAQALQSAMRQFAAVPVPGQEAVALSVKIAVASGAARRWIVGDPAIQRIELIAGATILRMAEAEHQAVKGEVIFDEPTVQQLGACVKVAEWRRAGTARFAVLAELAPAALECPWPEWPELPLEKLRPWALPAVFAQLASGAGDFMVELRPAAALFLRFGGIDYDNDPQAGDKLDSYICWVQSELARHEAVLTHPTIGDKGSFLCMAFGAPLAHEDDIQRAAAAALALSQPPPELAFITPAQVGLSQGTARTGSYGGRTRRAYDILGDQVNLAARLMVNARPGEILVSERVRESLEQGFTLTPLPPIQVKGKTQAAAIARLEGLRQAAPGEIAGAETPLFGREAEIAILEQVIGGLRQRAGGILHIIAESGLGKTRLAAELAHLAREAGLRVLSGSGQSTRQDAPYLAWRSVFSALLGWNGQADPAAFLAAALRDRNPQWAELTPLSGALLGLRLPDNSLTTSLEAQARQAALHTLAVQLLEHAVLQQPLLILLDDAHWLDESGRILAIDIARSAAASGYALVLLQRPAEGLFSQISELDGYQMLPLPPLAGEAIQALALECLAAPASPLLPAVAQAQAQGNPHYAIQLLKALQEGGSLAQAQGRWVLSERVINALRDADAIEKNLDTGEWQLRPEAVVPAAAIGLPDSVQGLMLARLDRLPEAHKLTLRAACVAGREFDLPLLCAAHPAAPGEAALQAELSKLVAGDFLRPCAAGWAFPHATLQEALYNSLSTASQESLHGRVGTALAAAHPEDVALLAYHFTRAGSAARPQALQYLDQAAQEAQRNYANATALNYYRQALSIEERWEWRKGQAEVLHLLGVRDEEAQAIVALEAMPDAPRAEVYKRQYELHQATADYPQAIAAGEQLLALSRACGDWLGEAESLRQLGLAARRQGDNDAARRHYQQARDILDNQTELSLETRRMLANLMHNWGMLLLRTGSYHEAQSYLEETINQAQVLNDRYLEVEICLSLGSCRLAQKDYSEAQADFEQAARMALTIGSRRFEAFAYNNLAMIYEETGAYTKQREYLLMALHLLQATGDQWNEANTWNSLGVLHQMLGQYLEAAEALEKARQLCLSIGDQGGLVYILINLALARRDQDELAEAESLLREGLALAIKVGDAFMEAAYHSQSALLAARQGRYEESIVLAEQALSARRELGCETMTSDNLAALAQAHLGLGHAGQALSYARQALKVVADCGGAGPENPIQDDYLAFQVLEALGEEAEARLALQEAYNLLQQRAAGIQEAELRESFLTRVPLNHQVLAAAERLGLT